MRGGFTVNRGVVFKIPSSTSQLKKRLMIADGIRLTDFLFV
jgi:hypothetical protein